MPALKKHLHLVTRGSFNVQPVIAKSYGRICFANYTDTLGDTQANGRDGGSLFLIKNSLQRSCVPGVTGTCYVFDGF